MVLSQRMLDKLLTSRVDLLDFRLKLSEESLQSCRLKTLGTSKDLFFYSPDWSEADALIKVIYEMF